MTDPLTSRRSRQRARALWLAAARPALGRRRDDEEETPSRDAHGFEVITVDDDDEEEPEVETGPTIDLGLFLVDHDDLHVRLAKAPPPPRRQGRPRAGRRCEPESSCRCSQDGRCPRRRPVGSQLVPVGGVRAALAPVPGALQSSLISSGLISAAASSPSSSDRHWIRDSTRPATSPRAPVPRAVLPAPGTWLEPLQSYLRTVGHPGCAGARPGVRFTQLLVRERLLRHAIQRRQSPFTTRASAGRSRSSRWAASMGRRVGACSRSAARRAADAQPAATRARIEEETGSGLSAPSSSRSGVAGASRKIAFSEA